MIQKNEPDEEMQIEAGKQYVTKMGEIVYIFGKNQTLFEGSIASSKEKGRVYEYFENGEYLNRADPDLDIVKELKNGAHPR